MSDTAYTSGIFTQTEIAPPSDDLQGYNTIANFHAVPSLPLIVAMPPGVLAIYLPIGSISSGNTTTLKVPIPRNVTLIGAYFWATSAVAAVTCDLQVNGTSLLPDETAFNFDETNATKMQLVRPAVGAQDIDGPADYTTIATTEMLAVLMTADGSGSVTGGYACVLLQLR